MKFDNLIISLLKEEEPSREDRLQAMKDLGSVKMSKFDKAHSTPDQQEAEQRYEAAEELFNELWDEDGDGEVSLAPLHYAITGVEWDGEDESRFDEIIETMREQFKTRVSIDPEREAVILIGALDEEEDI